MNKSYICLILLFMMMMAGCTEATRVHVYKHFWYPSSFSPNGDGLNETFNPMPQAGILFSDYHIIIFNENLQVLFESNDKDARWDPIGMHQDISPGSYEYQIVYTASEDSVHYSDYITNFHVNVIK